MRAKLTLFVVGLALVACSEKTIKQTVSGGSDEVGQTAQTTVGASGGTITTAGGTAFVSVPSGALANDVVLSVVVQSPNSVTASPTQQPNLVVTGNVYDFGPNGTTFTQPVAITVQAATAAAAGQKNVLAYLDTNNIWQILLGSSEQNGVITAWVTHFTKFAVVSVPSNGAGCTAQNDPNAYCAPQSCDANNNVCADANSSGGTPSDSNTSNPNAGGGSTDSGGTTPPANGNGTTPPAPSIATQLVFTQSVANGTIAAGTSFSIAVSIEDAAGLVVDSDAFVNVVLARGGEQPSGPGPIRAVHGVVTISDIQLTTVGAYQFSASSDGLAGASSDSFKVTVGAASPDQTRIVAFPQSAKTGGSVTLYLTLIDAYGNPIANVTPQWSTLNNVGTITPSGAATDPNGLVTATLTSDQNGEVQVTATLAGISVLTSVPFSTTQPPPPPPITTFGTLRADPPQVPADGAHFTTLSAQIRDAQGQPLVGVPAVFTVPAGVQLLDAASTTDNNGVAVARARSVLSGPRIVSLQVNDLTLRTTVFFAPNTCSSQSQPGQRVLSAGNTPVALTHGDLNNDQSDDLAVANTGDGTFSVFLRGPDTTFGPQQLFGLGGSISGIINADVNSDGFLDVIVTSGVGYFATALGNGDGTFQELLYTNGGFGTVAVAAADLNGDSVIDLVTANGSSDEVDVYLGNNDGTFADAVSYSTGAGSNPKALALADVDGDGNADVVVALSGFSTQSVVVLPGAGDGTLGAVSAVADITNPSAVVQGSFGGSGGPDFLVLSGEDAAFFLLLNDGQGTLTNTSSTPVSPQASNLTSADVNSDGNLDVIVLSTENSEVSVFVAISTGFFGKGVSSYKTGQGPQAVVAFDTNGDGNIDIAIANRDGSVTVLEGVGDGTFPLVAPGISVGDDALAAVSGDFNGDGAIDLVVPHNSGSSVDILLNSGSGQLVGPTSVPAGLNPTAVVVTDVNADGFADLVVANNDKQGHVSVLLGNGSGTFAAPVTLDAGVGTTSVAVGDVDGDHLLDIVAANSIDGTLSVFFAQPDGSFSEQTTYPINDNPVSLTLVDLNQDNVLDAVVANAQGNTISVAFGEQGGFGQPTQVSVGNDPESLVVTDLNGDAFPDVIVANVNDQSASVLFNDAGTLSLFNTMPFPYATNRLVLGDINADGVADLVVSPPAGQPIATYLGSPSDGLGAPSDYVGAAGLVSLADINGDGYPDFVVTDATNTLTTLINAGCAQVSLFNVASPTLSTFSAGPAVAADGVASLVVEGTLLDAAGTPIPNMLVQMSGDNPALVSTPDRMTTDANGHFSTSVTSTESGTLSLGILVGTVNAPPFAVDVSFTAVSFR